MGVKSSGEESVCKGKSAEGINNELPPWCQARRDLKRPDLSDWVCPAEDPIGFIASHVDAARNHGKAKIFGPICTVKGMTLGSKERSPWDARKYIVIHISQNITKLSDFPK